jgi:hypothetical protein
MKSILLFLLLILPFVANSQVQKKVEYIYNRDKKVSTGSSIVAGILFKDYDLENDIKVRGIDDSLMADNVIKISMNNENISFFDVTGMQIPDSFHATFFGTFYVRNYDLSLEEQNKKVISRKGGDGVIQLTRVQRDTANRPYFNDWTNSGSITVVDSLIKSIRVVNSNIWVNSTAEKRKIIRRFESRKTLTQFFGGIIALGALAYALRY